MSLALEPASAQVGSVPRPVVVREGYVVCQARGCGPRCEGPVRSYEVRAEDHCPECEGGDEVHALILHNVTLCLAHAGYATDLGMIALPGVR